ncbi:amidase family protein, partial [Hydrogenophaga sp.]|uniref:amidase family protein n=1 Tax=Hydrogenophaga sp. TaxID=1904254 RepID=UPI0027162AA8
MTSPPLSLAQTAHAVARGERRATDVIEACIARIEATEARVNAFTGTRFDAARAQAQRVDAQRARGEPLGPLAGVPFAVKNLFDIAGEVTLAGSQVNRSHPPATAD